MKNILKSILLFAFSVSFFCASAQNNSANPAEEKISEMIERLIDSLQRTQVLKKESTDTLIVNGCDFKEINLGKSFPDVEILGDVNLILTNGPNDKLVLKGDPFDLERTKVAVENGKLIISRANKTRSKLQISMSVANITRLLIDGDSEVFSSGTVNTKALQIILGGTSMVSVRYNGKLDVCAGPESELIDIADYRKIAPRK